MNALKKLFPGLVALIFCFCLAGAPEAWSAQGQLIQTDSKGEVTIRADEVIFEDTTGYYIAAGQVEVTRGDIHLFADRVRMHGDTMVAEAEGDVRLMTPSEILSGERLLVDMVGGTGKIYQGHVFSKPNHFYVRGSEIEKVGRDTYRITEGGFTTCDGENPNWELTSSEMEVTMEGYGTSKDTSFRIRDLPVLWTPWLIFPAKFQRQSGLLPPQMGTSDRDGFILSQPYFQTLGDSQDATVTLNYMTRRGLDLGLEYRYNYSNESKGMLMIDYLFKDERGEDLFLDGDNASDYNERWWIRAKADQELFNKMHLRLDVDLVSDQDYIQEFGFGYTGFSTSNDRFNQMFGRELDTRYSMVRQNTLNLQRHWDQASLNAAVIYYDRLDGDNDTTIQQLPTISFDATRQAVGETGFYFQMGSGYSYNYREDGSTGHILDVSPTISLPLNFNDYVEVEPSFYYSQRVYAQDSLDRYEDNIDRMGLDEDWIFKTQIGSYLYRVFDFGSASDPLKIKHAVRPNVTYSYRPSNFDDDVPQLSRRNISRENRISYGLENSFTSKMIQKHDETGEMKPVYREFMRFNLYHSFDVAKYRSEDDTAYKGDEYWGNVDARVEFIPHPKYLNAEADASFNVYDGTFDSFNAMVKASDTRGDSITFDYLYTRDSHRQINGRLRLAVTDELYVAYTNRHDFMNDQDFESIYEVGWEGQCWGIRTYFYDDTREQGFYIVFSLGGFGEVFGF